MTTYYHDFLFQEIKRQSSIRTALVLILLLRGWTTGTQTSDKTRALSPHPVCQHTRQVTHAVLVYHSDFRLIRAAFSALITGINIVIHASFSVEPECFGRFFFWFGFQRSQYFLTNDHVKQNPTTHCLHGNIDIHVLLARRTNGRHFVHTCRDSIKL